jgi:hypothetical protein
VVQQKLSMRDKMKEEIAKIEVKINYIQSEKYQPQNRSADK